MNQNSAPQIFKRISFTGAVYLIQNDAEMRAVSEKLNSAKELGFDTETKPSFKKGEVYQVALLQFATENEAFLVRLHYLKDFQILKSILENKEILKVGAALRDDLRQLSKVFQFDPQNFTELQTLAKMKGLKSFGLKSMSEELLQATLSKGPKMTNWEAAILSEQQLNYAATDAWIGLKLYHKLKNQSP